MTGAADAGPIRLILLPPYRGAGYDYRPDQEPYYRRVLDQMAARRELVGVTIEIDPGVPIDHPSATRDQSVFDQLAVAVLGRVRELATRGQHDAIVVLGAIDVAFHSARMASPVPVTFAFHSAIHIAATLGDRISSIDVSDPQAARQRRLARDYQLEHKLASVRVLGHTSTELSPILRDPAETGRPTPASEALVVDIVEQCRVAIELDRADVLIVGFTPFQILQDEVRQRLDDMGFGSIPVVWTLSAAVSLARAMVGMGLLPSGRAFPSDALAAKPAYR